MSVREEHDVVAMVKTTGRGAHRDDVAYRHFQSPVTPADVYAATGNPRAVVFLGKILNPRDTTTDLTEDLEGHEPFFAVTPAKLSDISPEDELAARRLEQMHQQLRHDRVKDWLRAVYTYATYPVDEDEDEEAYPRTTARGSSSWKPLAPPRR